eukprot:CAMPEP_0172187634 /NCGR_PEP_ID=MMETSP1050-20130122/21453_1 /TAXON_ID=233186 /ORGANISM="Cryptomonas curvata, Strain CCAP979/52" /LENGTH=166 /DNA_ID=CAMNT_0012861991 /DNA_START=320 /DNA_END=817 /DNA_ORIENTATION=-
MPHLYLRGGQTAKSVKRSRSASPNPADKKMLKKRKSQPAYNLPPAGWRDKIKNPDAQRSELSGKGRAKGRTKPSFHFWTKKRIKVFVEDRQKHRELVRKQQANLPIKNFGKGVRRCKFKWLPSAYEKEQLDLEEARKKQEKLEAEAKERGPEAVAADAAAAEAAAA